MSPRPARPPRGDGLRAWLEILRAPNFLTLPGNVLAGLALSPLPFGEWDARRTAAALLAGALLYGFGLLANDLADEREDLRERPARPLPSGRVPRRRALAADAACAAGGVFAARAAGPGGAALGLGILALGAAYNLGAKRRALPGILALAACRAMLLLLGATPAGRPFSPPVLAGAGITALYVAALSAAARGETRAAPPGRVLRALPLAAVLAGLAAGLARPGSAPDAPRLALALLAGLAPARFLFGRDPGPEGRPGRIGRLIGNLCLVHAALGAWPGPEPGRLLLMLGVAGLAPLHGRIARRFPAS